MSQTWYTREEAETSEKYGSTPSKRTVEELLDKGFVIVDKPFGPTSNQVSTWVKDELDRKKTGHFGTLDPNATGVLPVGLNQGTRIQKALSNAEKEYVFEAELEDQKDYTEIKKKLESFEGVNKQTPPEKSAVKKEEREREAYEVKLIEVNEKNVLGRVRCESGFYVRVLIDQLGDKLSTEAEMTELRRTKQADIDEDESNTLQDIVDAYHFYHEEDDEAALKEVLQPIERAVNHLPKVVIKDSAVNGLQTAQTLEVQV